MSRKEDYLNAQAAFEEARIDRPFIPKATTANGKYLFLSTKGHLPYSKRWFFDDIKRLNAMYDKEYRIYFNIYIRQRRAEIEAENRLKMMKRLYEQEKRMEQEVYPC